MNETTPVSNSAERRLIVNCLPLTPELRRVMQDAAPGIPQLFTAPTNPAGAGAWSAHIPKELVEKVTAVIGTVNPDELSHCEHLEWLQTWSAGTDRYVKGRVIPQNAVLTNASGAYGQVVSEHMFAMMWALMKNLHTYARNQEARLWQPQPGVASPRGATALVVGTGDIGSHFAQLAKLVGMRTLGVRRHADRGADGIDEMHTFSELDALLTQADVVALVVPSTPETHHLLDAHRLSLLKPNAILINVGRGDAIEPDALADTLQRGLITGAALDVTEPEPLAQSSPLWREPRCLITPHVAGEHLPETKAKIFEIALANLKRYADGSLG